MATKNKIDFKGTKEGIVLYLDTHTEYVSLKETLLNKLSASNGFFKGATIVDIVGKTLEETEIQELNEILMADYDIKVKIKERVCEEVIVEKEAIFDGLEEGMTKFVKQTLRSGTKIDNNGNVVILGEVNPGAVIVASGNIVVMGVLRGVAHAGANGIREAYILANSLRSNHIRIETLIARAPDNTIFRPKYPEIAYILNNSINIEPHNVKIKKKKIKSSK